jgi:probable HAF family extracellular repeat protein
MVGNRPRRFLAIHIIVVLAVLALNTTGAPTQSPPPTHYGISEIGPAGAASAAYDTAEYGQVLVGRAQAASGAFHAFARGFFGLRDLGTLGGAESTAFAVHSAVVVGQAQIASGEQRAFAADVNAGTMTNLGTLGGSWSVAFDIRSGFVVGASRTSGDARVRAFQYESGTMSPVAVDWGGDSVAKGVNGSNEIVGYACTSTNAACRAFLVSSGIVSDLGPANGRSVANGINDRSQIVGSFMSSATAPAHAFRYASGVMTDLGTLGGATSEGLGINERGDVVGSSLTSAGETRAFLWREGVMTDLNALLPPGSGWHLESATSISDGGQIVGIGTVNGVKRAFLLTPPTDLSLWIGGVRSLEDSNLPRGVEAGRTVRWVTSAQALVQEAITVYGATITHTLTGPAEFVSARAFDNDSCQVTPTVVTCRLDAFDSPGIGREVWVTARTTGQGHFSHHATITSDVPDAKPSNDSINEDNRAVSLSTFFLSPGTVPGGKASAAHFSTTDMPPAGDAIIRLSSSRPDVVPVPSTFVIPAWTQTRALNIIPAVVSSSTTVDITATYGLVTIIRTLTVVPPKLAQLYLTPTTVVGGCGTSAGRILLTGAAPSGGGVVPLTNTNAKAAVPASVTVPAGANSVTFSVATSAVTTPAYGNVTASYGGVAQALPLTVRPIRVQTLGLSPNPVRGGTMVTGTIALECPAAPGAIAVTLTSSNPNVATPTASSIIIPAGARTGSFAIRTAGVAANTPVTINAWVFGVRTSATLTVTNAEF